MNPTALKRFIVMVVFVALIIQIQLAAQAQSYGIANLGTLGGTSSAAIQYQ
jgi:hypothetical protein